MVVIESDICNQKINQNQYRVDARQRLHDLGYNLFPLRGKNPVVPTWTPYQSQRVTPEEFEQWSRLWFGGNWDGIGDPVSVPCNWGMPTGHKPYSDAPALVVVDTDNEAAEAVVRRLCPDTPVMQRTGGGGVHRVYRRPSMSEAPYLPIRNGTTLGGVTYKIDIRADGGFIVAPGSIHPVTGRSYREVKPWTLDLIMEAPVYDWRWMKHEGGVGGTTKRSESGESVSYEIGDLSELQFRVTAARNYLKTKPGTASGESKASNQCFALAVKVVHFFKLPEEQAVELMEEWGQKDSNTDSLGNWYPWSRKDIVHKVRDASRAEWTGDRLDMLRWQEEQVHNIVTPFLLEEGA